MKWYYTKEDLKSNKYVITEWVEEDGVNYIVSMHKDKLMAEKRLKYLQAKARKLFEKGIDSVAYGLHTTDEERIKLCWNYERRWE